MYIDFQPLFDDVEKPKYATHGSSGFDLVAHNFKTLYNSSNYPVELAEGTELVTLAAGYRLLVGTGFALAIPQGAELQIRSRSGKSLREGLIELNQPGTIDSDYRGEIGMIIFNTSGVNITIRKGDRLTQGVIAKVEHAQFNKVNYLSDTKRGSGGYGHTGTGVYVKDPLYPIGKVPEDPNKISANWGTDERR